MFFMYVYNHKPAYFVDDLYIVYNIIHYSGGQLHLHTNVILSEMLDAITQQRLVFPRLFLFLMSLASNSSGHWTVICYLCLAWHKTVIKCHTTKILLIMNS